MNNQHHGIFWVICRRNVHLSLARFRWTHCDFRTVCYISVCHISVKVHSAVLFCPCLLNSWSYQSFNCVFVDCVCVCVSAVHGGVNNRGNLICPFLPLVSLLSLSGTDVCEGIRADVTLVFPRCQQLAAWTTAQSFTVCPCAFPCVYACVCTRVCVYSMPTRVSHRLLAEIPFLCMSAVMMCVWRGVL